MGLLTLEEKHRFEQLAADCFAKDTYDELLEALEERIKKYGRLGEYDKVQRTKQRLHWARVGRWDDVAPTEVIDLVSSDEDETPTPQVGPSNHKAAHPARHNPPPIPRPSSSRDTEVLDLTQTASEASVSDRDETDDATSEDDEAPRAPSPELFGEGRAHIPTPPTSPSNDSSPKDRRRSGRPPRQSKFFGNLVAHPVYERDAVAAPKAGPAKKKKDLSGKASPAKVKKEQKPIKPIFLTPEVATSVGRLFPSAMYRSTSLHEEMDDVRKADEEVLAAVERDHEAWKEEDRRRTCSPADDEPVRSRLREDRTCSSCKVGTFEAAKIGGELVRGGEYVAVAGEGKDPWFGRVVYFHQHPHRSALQVHLQWCSTSRALHGSAAHPRHLLLRDTCSSIDSYTILRKIKVEVGTNATVPPDSFFLCALYHSDRSTTPIPALNDASPYCDRIEIRACWACEDHLRHAATHAIDPTDKAAIPLPRWLSQRAQPTFRYDDHDYHIGDSVYLLAPPKAQEHGHWSGAQAPFRLALLEAVDDWDGEDPMMPRPALKPSTKVRVKPVVRLGHIVAAEPGQRRERDVVLTNETTSVAIKDLVGTFILKQGAAPPLEPYEEPDVFYAPHYLAESLDATTETAILSVWATPPRLLHPHEKLKVALEPLLLPLEHESAIPTCSTCKKEHRHEQKDEEKYRVLMENESNKPTAISLYSGIDLFGMGLTAGCPELKVKYAVEFDAAAAKACRDNHPDTNVLTGDVAQKLEEAWQAEEGDPKRAILDVDVVFGGPPCQEFSRANLHKNRDDPRPLQPFVFLGFLESGRPSFALAENVMGLATFKREEKGDVFGLVCDLAIRLGYDLKPVALNAAAFGVAQHRRRLFLQLTKRGLPIPAAPEPTHAVSAKFTRIGTRYGDEAADTTVYTATTRRAEVHSAPLPAVTVGEALSDPDLFPSFDAETQPVSTAKGLDVHGNSTHVHAGLGGKTGDRVRAVGFHYEEGKEGNWLDFDLDESIRLNKPPTWNNLAVDCWRRVWIDEISAPLLTKLDLKGSNGARIHWKDNRGWSVAEALQLQGAPTNLKVFPTAAKGKPLAKADLEVAYKLVGNAVCVPVAAAFGRELHKVLRSIVLDSPNPPSSTFFADVSRSVDVAKAVVAAPAAQAQVEVIVLDDDEDEDEEMYDAASTDSERTLQYLDDGADEGDEAGPFEGVKVEEAEGESAEEDESDEEVVVLSSPKKRRRDVVMDTDSD
ncbi:hypothetical protein JCM6882_005874 [Rhodosporidiobolus microsporus]